MSDYKNNYDQPRLHEEGFLRLKTILQIIPIGRSTWWEGVQLGKFPKPIKIGRNITVWRTKDIQLLIEKLNSGETNE